MKALVKRKSEPGLWLEEVPDPEIGINDVLIRVHKTGICGTDLHIYSWDDWAQRTIRLAEQLGRSDIVSHALNNMGTPRLIKEDAAGWEEVLGPTSVIVWWRGLAYTLDVVTLRRTVSAMHASTIVVPMSGCFITSAQGIRISTNGRSRSKRP